jgi:hypothetical protein
MTAAKREISSRTAFVIVSQSGRGWLPANFSSLRFNSRFYPSSPLAANLSLLHNGIYIVSRFKENPVPNESATNKIPEEALNAFLDGVLAEIKSPPDPRMLTMVRSIFRKRIPLHMRSYAAALLILRAAGITRSQPPKPVVPARSPKENFPARSGGVEPHDRARPAPAARQPSPTTTSSPDAPHKAPPPRNPEGMVPLFVSMGKRQRLRPQELRTLVSEKTGIPTEELGRVHLFDNYSFLDVQEAHAEQIIAAADGAAFKGRTVEIKPAKKKSEQPPAKEQNE